MENGGEKMENYVGGGELMLRNEMDMDKMVDNLILDEEIVV